MISWEQSKMTFIFIYFHFIMYQSQYNTFGNCDKIYKSKKTKIVSLNFLLTNDSENVIAKRKSQLINKIRLRKTQRAQDHEITPIIFN